MQKCHAPVESFDCKIVMKHFFLVSLNSSVNKYIIEILF